MKVFIKYLIAMFFIISINTAYAHDFWLEAHGKKSKNSITSISARVGPGWPGKQSVRLDNMVDSLQLFLGNDKGKNIDGRDNSYVFGHYNSEKKSTELVVLQTKNFVLKLPAFEFNQYLDEEGLKEAVQYRKKYNLMSQDSTELFHRIAKIYPNIIKDNSFNRILNLSFEISLVTDPLTYKIKSPFILKITTNGRPIANKQIKAQNKDSTKIFLTETDDNGIAIFNLNEPGQWLFSSVNLQQLYHGEAQWQSTWSSLVLTIDG